MASQKRRKATYANVRQMEKIDMLLAGEPEHISMTTGAEKPIIKQQEVLSKAEIKRRILESSQVKYAYSKGSKVIHDKSCAHVDGIKLDNLKVSKDYIPTKVPCPKCEIVAYIREGGGFIHKDEYLDFFARAQFDSEQIRELFITAKARTQISGNTMTVRIDSEIWRLRILEAEEYGLELKREEGFVKKWINAKEALYFMKNKNWCAAATMMSCSGIKNRIRRWCKKGKRGICHKLRTIKKMRGGLKKKTVYYIDGDNDPETRIIGIDKLRKDDIVKIFCSKDHSYYDNQYRQEKLKNECKCKIEFFTIIPGPDAVDFAIGLDAYKTYIKKPGWRILLLSADRHFTVIKRQIDILSHGIADIKHIKMICQANRKEK